MANPSQICCTPAECVKLRRKHSQDELNWAAEVMAYYGCRPRKEDGNNLREFIADVFAAGRISGVREERQRRKHTEPVLSPVKADIIKCLGRISEEDAIIIAHAAYECMRA